MAIPTTIAGTWAGTYELWLDPAAAPERFDTGLEARRRADGRAVTIDYDWSRGADSHSGTIVLVLGDDGVSMAFTDSFHSGRTIMQCSGSDPRRWSALGTYDAMEQTWGWRTQVEQPSDDELLIQAWNVEPDGTEHLATRATYRRA